ncbi:uncharacterized protein LOC114289933 [Camellia sinensis]|uniref:uncharacterized protein LOC114289933 n=1 Tax=Camellia sinensis TaxID=4442 RepID=UPI001036A09F|nr:uncharacterized protein LOC114289933 [Camellia sinensis]
MGFNPCKLNFVLAIHLLKSISKSTWGKKVEVYKKWGWSGDEILEAFGKHPLFIIVSENKIMRVVDFFVNKIGWESSLIARKPVLVSLSLEKRTVLWWAVYEILLSKGLIKSNNNSLTNMLVSPEKCFLKKFVNCHEEEAPKLLKLYKEKLALAKQL